MTQILILDDNSDLLALLTMALERHGLEVRAARNGQEGLEMLANAPTLPDAILSNLRMPRMDGLTFLEAVRKNHAWASIPVVLMSAVFTENDRQTAESTGVQGFLQKPFSIPMLEKALKDLGLLA